MSRSDLNDGDEVPIFFDVSDEDLERASGACDGIVPTLLGTYCFTCPVDGSISFGNENGRQMRRPALSNPYMPVVRPYWYTE
jgi:hypothetical protein